MAVDADVSSILVAPSGLLLLQHFTFVSVKVSFLFCSSIDLKFYSVIAASGYSIFKNANKRFWEIQGILENPLGGHLE